MAITQPANLQSLQRTATEGRAELARLNYLNMTYMQANYFAGILDHITSMTVANFYNVFIKTYPVEWREKPGIGIKRQIYDTTQFSQRLTNMRQWYFATVSDIDQLVDSPLSKPAAIEREKVVALGHLKCRHALLGISAPIVEVIRCKPRPSRW